MKIYIVTASIRELDNLKVLIEKSDFSGFNKSTLEILIVDEVDGPLRKHNQKLLAPFDDVRFFGQNERQNWFKKQFGSNAETFAQVIPEKCHAETSFGFLVAYEEGADFVIELDDDVIFHQGHGLEQHLENLFSEEGVTVSASGKWYNTMENLILNHEQLVFPRGHPYSEECREEKYTWNQDSSPCVANMGLWSGEPDYDAVTLIYYGGLDGTCYLKGQDLKREKVVVDKGTYFALCSMNAAFSSKIIPAFYQLYMNQYGVDRFDDIWSGIFLKRIADHLNESIALGSPLVNHQKAPRDSFSDLRKELEGMDMNERLWREVDSLALSGKNYLDAYKSLTDQLLKGIPALAKTKSQTDFLKLQVEKMNLWAQVIDNLD